MPCRLPTRLLLSFLVSFLVLVLAAFPAAADAPPPAVASVVGAYAGEGPHELLVISPRAMGNQRILVLTDLGTGAIRALFPAVAAADEAAEPSWPWVAGETLRSPEPPAFRLRFEGAEEERPTGLAIEDVTTGAVWRARRVPLRTEEVQIRRDGLSLRGTLHLPSAAPPGSIPGIVLAPGSEDEGTRHSLDALPYVLVREGFAVLAVDKRGTGASEGSWDVDHDTLADDLVAWIEWLAARPELDGRIGVFGFSEGGWIAPLAASRTEEIDFIAVSGGGALPKSASFLHQAGKRLEEEGLQGKELERAMNEKRSFIEASADRAADGAEATPFDLRMAHDPAPEWRRFRGPVLWMIGEDDALVPPRASAERMREVLARAGHPDHTVRLFPRATHGMFRSVTGAPSEFFGMEGLGELAPGYWETLLRWLDTRVARR
jgi:alpha-beta hydrolase superfamily lysophospholipase